MNFPDSSPPQPVFGFDNDADEPEPVKVSNTKKKRDIDQFLEELKAKQSNPGDPTQLGAPQMSEEEISFYGLDKGSFDNGDPLTTNLYLANLAPVTTGGS